MRSEARAAAGPRAAALASGQARRLERINEAVGRAAAWLLVAMLGVQFVTVLLRYVFSVSHPALSESVWYLHGLLFTLAAGYALKHDAHVRIDVFYAKVSERRRAWINLAGSLFLLLPVCILTLWLSSSYVINSWRVLEGSIERSGLPLVFALKTAIWAYAGLLAVQGFAQMLHAVAYLAFSGSLHQLQPGESRSGIPSPRRP